jgi:hypothetical protein
MKVIIHTNVLVSAALSVVNPEFVILFIVSNSEIERLEKSNYSVDFADFVKCFLGGKVTDCLPLSVCFLRQSANIAVIS